jgi:aspartate kinase
MYKGSLEYFLEANKDFPQNNKRVIKLGGTSQCKLGYDKLISYIKNIFAKNNNAKIFIVLSAISGVTNNLLKFTETKDNSYIDKVLELNYKLINELNLNESLFDPIKNKLLDLCLNYSKSFNMTDIYEKSEIIGYGEIFSSNIFYYYINSDCDFKYRELILQDSYKYIKSRKEIYQCNSLTEFYFDFNKLDYEIYDINIFQGFIGTTPKDKKVLLGRGGSDTTGSLIAAKLNAQSYEVWTDVDGIYTTDPNVISAAKLIKNIDYNLVQELSAMGAKVMHPLSIKPCADKNIPIYVKNTFNDASIFADLNTEITFKENLNDIFIATQKEQSVFDVESQDMWNSYGFVYDIFRHFSEKQVDVNIITTSQFSVSATTSETNQYQLYSLRDSLKQKYQVVLHTKCSIISVVCSDIKKIIKYIDFDKIKENLLITHIGNNNKTLNLVFKNFDKKYINLIYKMILKN